MNAQLKRKISENKIFLAVLGIFLTSLLAWGIWVTDCIYCAAADEKTTSQKVGEVQKDVDEVKQEVKEIRKENREDQRKMMDLLLDIKKDVKNNKK